jgi:hypothetical protein
MTNQILDEVNHPYVYHTPREISFFEIGVDTDQPRWPLHGVSVRGESPEDSVQGCNSTCDLGVVKRGMEIRLQVDLAGAIKR